MKILVTGASGLLGINLALEAAREHTVIGVVNENLFGTDAFDVRQVDLLAPHAVTRLLEDTQPDWIIHCAALANVDECENNPDLAYLTNAELPGEIARQVSGLGIPMAHISTDAVFDGVKGDYCEEDEPNPLSVYARTKLIGEQAVADAHPEAIIARVNLFGWSMTGKRSLAEFFFYNLRDNKRVNGFTDVFFCPMLVNDLAGVLIAMLKKELSGLFHVVGSICTSKYDFGVAVAEKFGLDAELITPTSVNVGGLSAARSPNLTLRSDKITKILGRPLPNFETGLSRLYELYQMGYPARLREDFISAPW
jgi:dTDP-4-dehydrorhamnose reductase